MSSNWAFRIHGYGGPEMIRRDTLEAMQVGSGEVLVKVAAAGINPVDRRWRTGFFKPFAPLRMPAQFGIELSGVVVAAAPDVSPFRPGDRVMGLAAMNAFADQAAVDAAGLCRTPDELSDVEAAAMPVAALMASQMLRIADLQVGQRVLIHGAAGAIGGFAVQLARRAGAYICATASAASRDHVLSLGADTVIDYAAGSFEEQVRDVDRVIDLVGGPVFARSLDVLRRGGVIISSAEPAAAAKAPEDRRGVFHQLKPDASLLEALALDVVQGRLRSTIAAVVRSEELADAIERVGVGHPPGKIVVDFGVLRRGGRAPRVHSTEARPT